MEIVYVSARDMRNKYYVDDIADCFFDYDSGCICEVFSDIADTFVDIYNSDLWDWAKNHTNSVEDAIREYGVDNENFSITNLFQQAQYLYYSDIMNERFEDLKKFYAYNHIYRVLDKDEIEEEKCNELDTYLSGLGQDGEIENIIKKVDELFGRDNNDSNN